MGAPSEFKMSPPKFAAARFKILVLHAFASVSEAGGASAEIQFAHGRKNTSKAFSEESEIIIKAFIVGVHSVKTKEPFFPLSL